VSERSTVFFCALVVAALGAAAGLLVLVVALGARIAAHAASVITAVSDCALSLTDTRSMPLAVLIPAAFGLASLGGLLRVLVVYRRERRFLRSLPLERLAGGELARIAWTTGIPVYQTPASRPAAFCFGLFRPRIVVTSGLVERLTDVELAAAVWHEVRHARVKEPLRCLLAKLVSNAFFWLPLLGDLFDRYTLTRELDADRLATARTSRHALAGALHGVVAGPEFAGAVGFADLASARVDRLLDPHTPLPSLFRRSRILFSIGAVALLALAFVFPTNVAVAKNTHQATMMMEMPVETPSGITWTLVPCG
jgi:hypothetical protein